MVNPRVFFDFEAGTESIGRVIFELFADKVPKTCENFRALTTGEKGLSRLSQLPLYYKGSIVHRSIKDFMIQGGDFTQRNGKGGESIYGTPFQDEDLSRPLDAPGLLVMANKGPDTNGSQWFITLSPCPHLNGKHVVFGRVIRGYAETVEKIAAIPTDHKDRPSIPVVISHCGELELRKPPPRQAEPQDVSSESETASESNDEKPRRSKRRTRSPTSDRDGRPPHKRSRRDKKKSSKHRAGKNDKSQGLAVPSGPHKETEEEYDARLEREEKERIAERRRREIARIKEQYDQESRSKSPSTEGPIRYKGRGRMKFIDPESTRHHNRDNERERYG